VNIIVSAFQSDVDVERAQEAELRSKYPNVKGPGASALLQKRLSKGVSILSVVATIISYCEDCS